MTFAAGLSYLGGWELLGSQKQSTALVKGALAALLSSGCSGPFLGPVFAATLKQPPETIFSLFMLVGLGMTTPYFFLPYFRKYIPKPGEWVNTFKQLAGFSLVGTAIWQLRAVPNPLGILVVFLGVAFECLFKNRYGVIVATSLIVAPFIFDRPNSVPFHSVYLEGDAITMVEFRTPLCLTCDLNAAILNSGSIRGALTQYGVQVLDADVSRDKEAAALLNELGYDSVPVLAVFRGDDPVAVLPDLITPSKVLDAIKTASR